MAKSMPEIEAAFINVFSSITIDDMKGGAITPTLFVDIPDVEEVSKRQFPAITLDVSEIRHDLEQETSEYEDVIEYNSVDNKITTRKKAHWYRIVYNVHSWSLYALQDRELTVKIENRLSPRDGLTVGDQRFWVFRVEFNVEDDDSIPDQKLYHKRWTFEILADIDNTDTDVTTTAVKEVHLESYTVRTKPFGTEIAPVNEQGNRVDAIDAVRKLHREIRFNHLNYWFPSEN